MATRRIRKVANPYQTHPGFDYDPTYDFKRDIAPALIGVSDVREVGSLTVATQPSANDTITVNGVVFTYKVAAASAVEITIGTNVNGTATNTAAKLNASTDPLVAEANYSASANVVSITRDYYGTDVPAAFTLASSAAHVTVSGGTLAVGGTSRYAGVIATFIEPRPFE